MSGKQCLILPKQFSRQHGAPAKIRTETPFGGTDTTGNRQPLTSCVLGRSENRKSASTKSKEKRSTGVDRPRSADQGVFSEGSRNNSEKNNAT